MISLKPTQRGDGRVSCRTRRTSERFAHFAALSQLGRGPVLLERLLDRHEVLPRSSPLAQRRPRRASTSSDSHRSTGSTSRRQHCGA